MRSEIRDQSVHNVSSIEEVGMPTLPTQAAATQPRTTVTFEWSPQMKFAVIHFKGGDTVSHDVRLYSIENECVCGLYFVRSVPE